MDEQMFPVCPYCEARIKGINWVHEEAASIRVFLCSECGKILSIQEWYGPPSAPLVLPNMLMPKEII